MKAEQGTANIWQKKTFVKVSALVDRELVFPHPVVKVIKKFMLIKYPTLDKEAIRARTEVAGEKKLQRMQS